MKKVMLILTALAFAAIVNAQGPWNGFFKPANQVVPQELKQLAAAKAGETAPTNLWLFRPAVSLTALAIKFGGGSPQALALNSMGFGLSYGRFSTVNDKAYCNYSFNASLLTQVELSEEITAAWGGALTADVFNKVFGLGVGYLDKHVMLLVAVSYSF